MTYIFHGVFLYIQGVLSTVLVQRLSLDILLRYIKHLFELPISLFEIRKTGEIISRFSDVSNIIEDIHGIESIKSMGVENRLYKAMDTKFKDTLKNEKQRKKQQERSQQLSVIKRQLSNEIKMNQWLSSVLDLKRSMPKVPDEIADMSKA